MIEMSVDKETVLSQPEGRSVDSHPHHRQPPSSFKDNVLTSGQAPAAKYNIISQDDTGVPDVIKMGSTAEVNPQEAKPADDKDQETGDNQAQLESNSGPQQQNNIQSQQRLNKRRSTMNATFKHPISGKRRRRANSESNPVLPTNFLLGGNIFDPLNLNSLLDEEVNRALNAETPKSSPLPPKSREPVEILIPRDITDPLNLNSGVPGGDVGPLISPLKTSGGRRRHRNRHHGGSGGATGPGMPGFPLAQPEFSDGERSAEGASATAEGLSSSSSSFPPPLSGNAAAGSTLPEGAAMLNTSPSTGLSASTVGTVVEDSRNLGLPNRRPPSSQRSLGGQTAPTSSLDVGYAAMTGPAFHHAPARQRKRRRASSRSESSRGSSTGPTNNKHARSGRDRASTTTANSSSNNNKHRQPFQTPVSSSGPRLIGRQQTTNANHHRGPNKQKPKKKFQYGNYTRYYGYRNPGRSEDPRLSLLRPEWFQGRTVLDLGCNTGHLTMAIAKQCRPSRIVGLDIDGDLIHAARQNIRYYLSEIQARDEMRTARHGEDESSQRGHSSDDRKDGVLDEKNKQRNEASLEEEKEKEEDRGKDKCTQQPQRGLKPSSRAEMEPEQGENCLEQRVAADRSEEQSSEKMEEGGKEGGREGGEGRRRRRGGGRRSPRGRRTFPVSLRISRGPIAAPPLPRSPGSQQWGSFPGNLSFVPGNYVLENDQLLLTQREEYDVILCLSVTKWVHLNWGDAGLRRLFHRAFRHLRPGGLFVLEPQPWSSYSRRKKLTDTIHKNYVNIRMKPDHFSTYLTSEVGFKSYELVGRSHNETQGFQRPIYIFHKGPSSKSHP
ncbi:7SK snRNA methylphosphate capping enzyme [Engraulis encrasicolus]|uniref:7SK snRNA methylphosphate capping enzyme n=1 Tax=Engraulis encrasicolus TaxID=184585 RepID=UPI002FD793BD